MKNLVFKGHKTGGVINVNVSATGPRTVEFHGQSTTSTTEAASPLPVQEVIVGPREPNQVEISVDDKPTYETPVEWIYHVYDQNFEIESDTKSLLIVKASLKRHIHFWRTTGASPFVLSVI